MTIVKCETCGKEFDKFPSQIKITKHNFCSRNCHLKTLNSGGANTAKCDCCGKEILRTPYKIKRSRQHFCSECSKKRPNKIVLKENHAEIIIKSPKYGIKNALIDLEDIQKCQNLYWTLAFDKYVNNFYVQNSPKNKTLLLHRVVTDCPSNMVVDHINHNTLDNRKINLRICTQQENMQNRKLSVKNKSGFTGVLFQGNKYIASICINYKNIILGNFDTLEAAKQAREQAELKYFAHRQTA